MNPYSYVANRSIWYYLLRRKWLEWYDWRSGKWNSKSHIVVYNPGPLKSKTISRLWYYVKMIREQLLHGRKGNDKWTRQWFDTIDGGLVGELLFLDPIVSISLGGESSLLVNVLVVILLHSSSFDSLFFWLEFLITNNSSYICMYFNLQSSSNSICLSVNVGTSSTLSLYHVS